MAKLVKGGRMPDFTFDTPYETGRSLAATAAAAPKTALVFLRYYGCTLCQYDIQQLARRYDELSAAGGQLLVVLQSDPQLLAGQLPKGSLPFEIICDPQQALYRQFEILPAPSMEKLADAKAMAKIAKAKLAGFKHGAYEGEELQLPAAFVLDGNCTLLYAHYGRTVADLPGVEELAGLLR